MGFVVIVIINIPFLTSCSLQDSLRLAFCGETLGFWREHFTNKGKLGSTATELTGAEENEATSLLKREIKNKPVFSRIDLGVLF